MLCGSIYMPSLNLRSAFRMVLTERKKMQKFNRATILVAAAIATLVLAGCSSDNSSSSLKIGSLLPETGSLAFLGPPEFAGVGFSYC